MAEQKQLELKRHLCDLAAQLVLEAEEREERGWFLSKTDVLAKLKAHRDARATMQLLGWEPGSVKVNYLSADDWAAIRRRTEVVPKHNGPGTAKKLSHVKNHFLLDDVRVAPSTAEIGKLAATLLSEKLPPTGGVIGVSCGTTLTAVARELASMHYRYPKLVVYSTVVLFTGRPKATLPSTLPALFEPCATELETLAYHLPTGVERLFGSSTEWSPARRHEVSQFLDERIFCKVYAANLILLGIGVLQDPKDRGSFTSHVEEHEARGALVKCEMAGEVLHWPYSRSGFIYDEQKLQSGGECVAARWAATSPHLAQFFYHTYTAKWSRLSRQQRKKEGKHGITVAVAGGVEKHEAMKSVLEMGRKTADPTIDVLVTDADALDYLYRESRVK